MSDVLEKAKAHFRSKFSGGLRSVEVPEWETVIYFLPMNMKERNQIHKKMEEDGLAGLIEALIVRARDSDGKHLFSSVHRTEFMREVDPDVVSRIIVAMNEEDPEPDMAELGKS